MKKIKNTKRIMAISAVLLIISVVFAQAVVAGSENKVTGTIVFVTRNDDGSVTIGIDVDGDGVEDIILTLYDVDDDELDLLYYAMDHGNKVTITYGNGNLYGVELHQAENQLIRIVEEKKIENH